MKIAKIPFAVWGLQYQIIRLPLALIENRLAARMGAEARAPKVSSLRFIVSAGS
jgi:hypothetical protein